MASASASSPPETAKADGGFSGWFRQISGGSTAAEPLSPSGGGGFVGWLRQISGGSVMAAEREAELEPELSDSEEEGAPAATSAPSYHLDGEQTLFGELADICLHGQVRSTCGKLVDVKMREFVLAAEKYHQGLSTLGSAVGMVLSDIAKNLACVKQLVEAEPEARKTHRDFMQVELDSGRHTPSSDGVSCQLNSGACQLQWLLRGLEMFLLMLKLLFDGVPDATGKAYSQSLQPYHSWMTSTGVRALLMAMPGKDSICSRKSLCPKLGNFPKELEEAIVRDVDRATSVMLPMVRLMISTCREFGLWESSQA